MMKKKLRNDKERDKKETREGGKVQDGVGGRREREREIGREKGRSKVEEGEKENYEK